MLRTGTADPPVSETAALDTAQELLDMPRSLPEDRVRQKLARMLESLGVQCELTYPTPAGPADIYLPGRRILIETKKPRTAASPEREQARPGGATETLREQLERYVRAEIRNEDAIPNLYETSTERTTPWTGILTDGRHWHAWRWTHEAYPRREPLQIPIRPLDAEALLATVRNLTSRPPIGKPRIPSNPTSLFDGFRDSLPAVQASAERGDSRSVATQQQLWLDMLRASSMAPTTDSECWDLFRAHCLLVTIARGVIHTIEHPSEDPDAKQLLANGFVAWIPARNDGEVWAQGVLNKVHSYEWRLGRTDVLRRVYQDFIPRPQRKVFGEYYTPDWLAEMLVRDCLDDEWCERSAQAALESVHSPEPMPSGIGVLDPACGSGTFLYHAAKRLLETDALRQSPPARQADAVVRLVHGIDVHPVAVELARATLLRALPAPPSDGKETLRVYMGDSLLASRTEGLFRDTGEPEIRIRTPGGGEIFIPRDFAAETDFIAALRQIVEAAQQPGGRLPSYLDRREDAAALHAALLAIRNVCETEGNSVWAWYIVHITAPVLLSERKVDRIVANPPWVRMSEVQDPERKDALESLAGAPWCATEDSLDLWNSGPTATGFDIAQLFIRRCREKYLAKPDANPAAWLVNASATSSGNWEKFRAYQEKHLRQVLDFSELRDPPFTGAQSAALLEYHSSRAAATDSSHLRAYAKQNRDPVSRDAQWWEASDLIEFEESPPLTPRGESAYTGCFRNGATIFPQPLVLLDQCTLLGQRAEVRTRLPGNRSKPPWGDLEPQEGNVPSRWVSDVIFSRHILPFGTWPHLEQALIPLDEKGELEDDPMEEPFWALLDRIYRENRGIGIHTPKTLLKRLNHVRAISTQLPFDRYTKRERGGGQASICVIYPGSGSAMRAARAGVDAVKEHGLYWWRAGSAAEAAYLVALLNAPSLRQAFKDARSSDRHFDLTPWKRVPIPRFDPSVEEHAELAALTAHAEAVTGAWLAEQSDMQMSQQQASSRLRTRLRKNGVLATIDKLAANVLPDQVR